MAVEEEGIEGKGRRGSVETEIREVSEGVGGGGPSQSSRGGRYPLTRGHQTPRHLSSSSDTWKIPPASQLPPIPTPTAYFLLSCSCHHSPLLCLFFFFPLTSDINPLPTKLLIMYIYIQLLSASVYEVQTNRIHPISFFFLLSKNK